MRVKIKLDLGLELGLGSIGDRNTKMNLFGHFGPKGLCLSMILVRDERMFGPRFHSSIAKAVEKKNKRGLTP